MQRDSQPLVYCRTNRTKYKIQSNFEQYKEMAVDELHNGNINSSIDALTTACALARNYYLCFADDTIEQLLVDLSARFIIENKTNEKKSERIAYYDIFAFDNMALSKHYMEAILQTSAEILYITTKDLNGVNSHEIRNLVQNNKNVHHIVIKETDSHVDYIANLCKAVIDFCPEKAIIHTIAMDIPGIIAWTALKGVERFFIDPADHVFQAGREMFDYYFAFRSLGYNLAVDKREIPKEKVLCLPFYPVVNNYAPYQGLPESIPGSIKILTGGRLEKVYGKGDLFFELLEKILEGIDNCEIYFIGTGASGRLPRTSYVIRQSRKRQYGKRFHFLEFRNDIIELMRHIDIYIGTYPIGGGLMAQKAASQGVPMVEYVSEGLSSSVGEFIDFSNKDQPFVFYDVDAFLKEVQKLAEDKSYRIRVGKEYQKKLFSKAQFNELFSRLIKTKQNEIIPNRYDFNFDAMRENQLEVENKVAHDFPRIVVKSKYIREHQPVKYVRYLLEFLCRTDRKWLLSKIRGK